MDVNMSITQALEKLNGKVVMQGGIPAVMVCKEGGSMEDFKKYIDEVILPLKGTRGFILGMSDNVPPNADFERIEIISKLIQ
jgi:uroporphyrinogen-III decarboxylase